MSDIQEWIKKIERGVWDGLGESSSDIMRVWAVKMVAMMKSYSGYPSKPPISILSGRLARAIQGGEESSDSFNKSETSMIYERIINVPYGAISEYGKDVKATDAMRRAMFAKLKELNQYKKDFARIGKGAKGFFEHKAYNFVKNSIEAITTEMIEPSVREHLETELNKIPNLEVTIGIK